MELSSANIYSNLIFDLYSIKRRRLRRKRKRNRKFGFSFVGVFLYARNGAPFASSLGISNGVKPFVSFDNNTILPYSSIKNTCLDKKQTLWAFFVLRSVVARADLRVG